MLSVILSILAALAQFIKQDYSDRVTVAKSQRRGRTTGMVRARSQRQWEVWLNHNIFKFPAVWY